MGCPSQSFHTTCDDADALGSDVPPALTTSGCEPGSSTARFDGWPRFESGKQSSEPASPDAATMVCPCRDMRSKIPFSVWRKAGSVLWMLASQSPQLVVTTWALSSLAIRLNTSAAATSEPFGAS